MSDGRSGGGRGEGRGEDGMEGRVEAGDAHFAYNYARAGSKGAIFDGTQCKFTVIAAAAWRASDFVCFNGRLSLRNWSEERQ